MMRSHYLNWLIQVDDAIRKATGGGFSIDDIVRQGEAENLAYYYKKGYSPGDATLVVIPLIMKEMKESIQKLHQEVEELATALKQEKEKDWSIFPNEETSTNA